MCEKNKDEKRLDDKRRKANETKQKQKAKESKKIVVPTVPRLRIWSPTILLTRLERA